MPRGPSNPIGPSDPNLKLILVMHCALQAKLGKKAIRLYQTLPAAGEVLKTHADISSAKADLGYSPHTTLDEGVAKFVAWFKDYYGPDGSKKRADEVQYVPD